MSKPRDTIQEFIDLVALWPNAARKYALRAADEDGRADHCRAYELRAPLRSSLASPAGPSRVLLACC